MSDAFSQFIARGIGPLKGMQRIPIPLESYQDPSKALASKRLLNLMAEEEPPDSRTQFALKPTSGLSLFDTIGTGPIRALNTELPGTFYLVSGTRFYRIRFLPPDNHHVVDDLGDIGTATAIRDYLVIITIAVGDTAAVVCVSPNAYACLHDDTSVTLLSGTFPGNAGSVCYMDGYFIFTDAINLSRFFISMLQDAFTYDPLDFASADAFPNSFTRCVAFGGNIWFLGSEGFEIWYDSGNADFPFRRQAGGTLARGIATPRAVAIGDESLFWVSVDGIAWRSEGFLAKRISTHAMEEVFRSLGTASILSALTYSQDGHIFFVVNFATRTVAYDVVTKRWHDRSNTDGTTRWRPDVSSVATNVPYLGDSASGKLYVADPTIGTEDGVPIVRQLELPPIWTRTNRDFCNRLEIEMEVGTPGLPASLLLEWSDDGGINWNGSRTIGTAALLSTRGRVYTTRLGSFRQRVFRITAPGHCTFYAVDADLTQPMAGG